MKCAETRINRARRTAPFYIGQASTHTLQPSIGAKANQTRYLHKLHLSNLPANLQESPASLAVEMLHRPAQ